MRPRHAGWHAQVDSQLRLPSGKMRPNRRRAWDVAADVTSVQAAPRPTAAIAVWLAAGLLAVTCLVTASPVRGDDPPSAVGPVMRLLQSNRLPPERLPAIMEMICERGNEHDLRVVFDRLLQADGMRPELRLSAMSWLVDAAETRKVVPTGDLAGLAALVSGDQPVPARRAAIRLASALRVAAVSPTLRELAADAQAPRELQQAAIDGLVELGGDENRAALSRLARESSSVAGRLRAVAALVALDPHAAAAAAAETLSQATPQDDPDALLDAFLDRKEGAELLAESLRSSKLSVDVAKRALRHMYSIGRNDAALSAVLSEAAGVAADPPPPTPEQVAVLAKEVMERGDPARGELIFRRLDLSCIRCHSLNRAGGQVGPDLSAVGGSSPIDYIINSVLNPNLAVKEQFATRVFETGDGRRLLGIIIDRDDSRVRIRDSQGKTIVLATADIDEEREGRSMMPDGVTKFLTHDELLDLIRFVSELGKPGPYGVRTVPQLQRWQRMLEPPSELTADVPHLEHLRELVIGSPPEAWASVYAKLDGILPLAELKKGDAPQVVMLRGEVQVNDSGVLGIKVETGAEVQCWLDTQSFGVEGVFESELEPGLHQVIVRAVLSSDASAGLRVEFTKPAGSSVQFEVVGGP